MAAVTSLWNSLTNRVASFIKPTPNSKVSKRKRESSSYFGFIDIGANATLPTKSVERSLPLQAAKKSDLNNSEVNLSEPSVATKRARISEQSESYREGVNPSITPNDKLTLADLVTQGSTHKQSPLAHTVSPKVESVSTTDKIELGENHQVSYPRRTLDLPPPQYNSSLSCESQDGTIYAAIHDQPDRSDVHIASTRHSAVSRESPNQPSSVENTFGGEFYHQQYRKLLYGVMDESNTQDRAGRAAERVQMGADPDRELTDLLRPSRLQIRRNERVRRTHSAGHTPPNSSPLSRPSPRYAVMSSFAERTSLGNHQHVKLGAFDIVRGNLGQSAVRRSSPSLSSFSLATSDTFDSLRNAIRNLAEKHQSLSSKAAANLKQERVSSRRFLLHQAGLMKQKSLPSLSDSTISVSAASATARSTGQQHSSPSATSVQENEHADNDSDEIVILDSDDDENEEQDTMPEHMPTSVSAAQPATSATSSDSSLMDLERRFRYVLHTLSQVQSFEDAQHSRSAELTKRDEKLKAAADSTHQRIQHLYPQPVQVDPDDEVGLPLSQLKQRLDSKLSKDPMHMLLDQEPRLSVKNWRAILSACAQTDPTEIVSRVNRQWLTKKSMLRLRDRSWLNDEIINTSLEAFKVRIHSLHESMMDHTTNPTDVLKTSGGGPWRYNINVKPLHVWIPATFFMNTLWYDNDPSGFGEYNYRGVRRWTKKQKIDITKLDRVIVPVNISQTHWATAMLDIRKQEAVWYDSLSGSSHAAELKALLRWWSDETADKLGESNRQNTSNWKYYVAQNVPQQNNAYDCGVFMVHIVEDLAYGVPFTFSQSDMRYLRRRLALLLVESDQRE